MSNVRLFTQRNVLCCNHLSYTLHFIVLINSKHYLPAHTARYKSGHTWGTGTLWCEFYCFNGVEVIVEDIMASLVQRRAPQWKAKAIVEGRVEDRDSEAYKGRLQLGALI